MRICCSLFLIIACITNVYSQKELNDYSLKQYTDENGLPQNSIKMITADGDFFWLGSENGLIRFDGHYFKVFNKKNTQLSSSRMAHVIHDKATNKQYVINDSEQAIIINNSRIEHKIHNVDSIFSNSSSLLNSSSVSNVYTELPLRFNPSEFNTFILHISQNEAIGIIRKDSIIWINKGKPRLHLSFSFSEVQRFFTLGRELYYLPANQDQYTRQYGNKVLISISPKGIKPVNITGELPDDPDFGKKEAKLYWSLASGSTFIYLNQSLYLLTRLPDGNFHSSRILRGFDLQKHTIISAYYNTEDKRIFLGSSTMGLFVFTPKSFITFKTDLNKENEVYYAQIPYGPASVLTVKGYEIGLNTPVRFHPVLNQHYYSSYTMLLDDKKNVWTTYQKQVHRFSPDVTKLLATYILPIESNGLYQTRNGMVWAGVRGQGLYMIDPEKKNDAVQLFSNQISGVSYMQEDPSGNFWVAANGLYKINIHTKEIISIPALKNKYIRSLLIPNDNEVWISTYEDGIFLYRDNKLISFPCDKGSYLKTAHCILEDKNGYLWITTNKGLFQVLKKELLDYADKKRSSIFYFYYERESGFNSNEFNGGCQPCGLSLSSGYFSFPSLDGLVWFKPESTYPDLPSKKIYIDDIEINGKAVPVNDTLICDKQMERLKISFSSPYFSNLNNLNFEYRLGDTGEWIDIDNKRDVSFTSFNSGVHHLSIRKINGFGNQDYTCVNITIIVRPAYWETWWFVVICFISAMLLFYLFMRVRLKYIEHQNKLLTKGIADSTAELNMTIFELENSRQELHRQTNLQKKLIAAITHDIKSPLNFLLITTRSIYKSLLNKESPAPDLTDSMQAIYSSSFQMYHFTGNLLEYAKTYLYEQQSERTSFSLAELITEKQNIFKYIAQTRKVEIINQVDPDLQLNSNRQLLSIIMHNLIDNAIKFTNDGTITIDAFVNSSEIILSIKDSGEGMKQQQAELCNESFPGRMESLTDNQQGGLGLKIVRELLNILKGRMYVKSKDGEGTEILLIFKGNDNRIL